MPTARARQPQREAAKTPSPGRGPRGPAAPRPGSLRHLQRQAGNQAMLRLHRQPSAGTGAPEPRTDGAFGGGLRASRGGGQPLREPAKTFLGASVGADLGAVRVHTDGRAARMSRTLGAEAFTYGRNIYFGEGRYAPDTRAGMRLLSHEVVHTLQQGMHDEAAPGALPVTHPGDASELEAERLSGRMMRGEALGGTRTDPRHALGARRLQPQIQRATNLDVALYETTDHGTGFGDSPSETFTMEANSLDQAGSKLTGFMAAAAKLYDAPVISQLSFYGHAAPGDQSVGAGEKSDPEKQITSASIDAYPEKFRKIYTPLGDGAGVFLRGCNAGAGQKGLDLLKKVKSSCKALVNKDITAYGWTGKGYHHRRLWYDWYEQTGERVSSTTDKPKLVWEDLKKLKKGETP
jgi:uncharacterized protein DUF4157/uncharacterized protein DUF4347